MTTTTTREPRCNVIGVAAERIQRELDDLGFPDADVAPRGDRLTLSLDLPDARRITALLRGVGS